MACPYRQLPLPLPLPDARLASVHAALAAADHAITAGERRRAASALGASLAGVAASRGRAPVLKPDGRGASSRPRS